MADEDNKSDKTSNKGSQSSVRSDDKKTSNKGSQSSVQSDAIATIEPEITAPTRPKDHLQEPEDKIDIDGPLVDIEKPEVEDVDLKETEQEEEEEVPLVSTAEEIPVTPEELCLTEPPRESTPVSARITEPEVVEATLEPVTPLPTYVGEPLPADEGVVLTAVESRPQTPTSEFRTSSPRREQLKLHVSGSEPQKTVYDFSAYEDDSRLTDEQFVQKMAAGQLTIQLEAASWKEQYNIS